jgi:hypothetical protein
MHVRRDDAAGRRDRYLHHRALWLGHEHERTTHVCLHADLALKQPPSTASAAQSHGDDQARSAARARCQRHCAIVISGAMVHALGTTDWRTSCSEID